MNFSNHLETIRIWLPTFTTHFNHEIYSFFWPVNVNEDDTVNSSSGDQETNQHDVEIKKDFTYNAWTPWGLLA